jgi:hypothetical protein
MSPATEEKAPEPVPDAKITIGNTTATTDENGHYLITGLQTESKTMAQVDPTSLDTTMTPERDFDILYFRKGTHIDWAPKLVSTVGIDGYIITDKNLPEGTKIRAVRMSDYSIVSKCDMEPDDYSFILEHLSSGKYMLYLDGADVQYKPYELYLKGTDEWISNIKWKLQPVSYTEHNLQELLNLKENIKKKLSSASDVGRYELDYLQKRANKLAEDWEEMPSAIRSESFQEIKDEFEVPVVPELQELQKEIEGKLKVLDPQTQPGLVRTYEHMEGAIDKLKISWPHLDEQTRSAKLEKARSILTSPELQEKKDGAQQLSDIRTKLDKKIIELKNSNAKDTATRLDYCYKLKNINDKEQEKWSTYSEAERKAKITKMENICNKI